jgi:hypothetical protein
MDTLTLNTLPLPELKQLAKARRIKQYYIMKRVELIRILSLSELPQSFLVEKLTIRQLRTQAKQSGKQGFWTLTRDQLVALLYPELTPSDKKHQDSNNSQQNESPKEGNPK